MSILERIQRITKANINNAIDSLESPAKMLKQSIREMEAALKDAKQAAADYSLTLKKMEKEREQLKRLRAEWEHKAEEAVRVGEDGMAKTALEEKIKAEERVKVLEPALAGRKAQYKELKEGLTVLQDQLKEAKIRLADLVSRKQAATAQKQFDRHLAKAVGTGVEDSAFDKFESDVLQTEAEAEVERDLRDVTQGADAAIEKKSAALRVESELEALKKRLKSE